MSIRILVVGGNGFIGSHVTDTVLADGADVTVFDRAQEQYRGRLRGVRYFQGHLADKGAIEEVFQSPPFDAVIHLAGGTSLPGSPLESAEADIDNLRDSVTLFQLCATRGVKKVVFISSGGTVYGIPKTLPVAETDPTDPICSYGVVKLAIEKYLLSYAHVYGINAVVLRLANPYGIRQSPVGRQGAVPIFMWKVLHGLPITIWGDGSTARDFVHIADAARACALAAGRECSGVFNIGSGQGLAIGDLVKAISGTLGLPANIVYQPRREFDVPRLVAYSGATRTRFPQDRQDRINRTLRSPSGLSYLPDAIRRAVTRV